MLSRLEKAEKNPNRGWTTNNLSSYSSDEEEETIQNSSPDDEVLLLDSDDEDTNSSKKFKSPLEYKRPVHYKIPKRSSTCSPSPSTPNGTTNDSTTPSSTHKYSELGFENSFKSPKGSAPHGFRPRTSMSNPIRYRINRQMTNRFSPSNNKNKLASPQPNLKASRTRKPKAAFDAEINNFIDRGDSRKETTENSTNKSDTDCDKSKQTAHEISDGETESENCDKEKGKSCELSCGDTDSDKHSTRGRTKHKVIDVNNTHKHGKLKQRTLDICDDICADSNKSVEYFATNSNKRLSTITSEDEDQEDKEIKKSSNKTRNTRHVFPSSKATPRSPMHSTKTTKGIVPSVCDDNDPYDKNYPTVKTCQITKNKSLKGKLLTSLQDDNKRNTLSDDDGSDTLDEPIHSNSHTLVSDDNVTKSNKDSFYSKTSGKVYNITRNKTSAIKKLTSLQDGDKKRKLANDDDDGNENCKEPAKKKKLLKTNKTRKKSVQKAAVSQVVLLSSDDEEEEPESSTKSTNHVSASSSETSSKDSNTVTKNSTKPPPKVVSSNLFQRDAFSAEIQLGDRVFLGSLTVSPKGPLEITVDNLKWKMECNDKTVTLMVRPSDFTSLKIHVDVEPKIIVLEVAQCLALRLRERFSGNGKFLDPGSPVSGERDIIFEVDDNLKQELIADLSEWAKDTHGKQFEELSHEDAEKLLACYTSQSAPKSRHYNTRSSSGRTTQANVTPTKLIIYPPPPQPGGITVTSADLECLAAGEFLNDVIIDFYLKYIYHGILKDKDRERTYIFSTYFYKRLTQKMSSDSVVSNDGIQSYPQRMHNKVKKWTRNVDIFEKDYIIVPINESSHWFLAIICFPHLEKDVLSESSGSEESGQESVEEIQSASAEDDSQDDDAFVSPNIKSNKDLPAIKASPCILIFDSLGGTGRARVYSNLRSYLTFEWKSKRPNEPARDFNKVTIKGTFPKVPQQDNHCDCGVFVLEYVESLFKDPIKNYRFPIDKRNWFTQAHIYSKREDIKALITCLSTEESTTLCNTDNSNE